MPIESPKLDDLSYDEVLEDLIRRIPVHAPEWTDYNDSDPGITLLQLFSHLAEQVGYRLNRVPEKNHIELLKLLGVRLQPAHAANTQLALLLQDPMKAVTATLSAGTRSTAKQGTPPPVYETDVDVDIVPVEPVVMITTRSPKLYKLTLSSDGTADTGTIFPPNNRNNNQWLRTIWDGQKPAYNALPTDPVLLFRDPTDAKEPHQFLWIGLKFNDNLDAGFRGVRVTLTLQFDDDERPSQAAIANCQCHEEALERAAAPVTWLKYFDSSETDLEQAIKQVPGRIDDSTAQFTRSGTVRFVVPLTIGAIPTAAFANLQDSSVPHALNAVTETAGAISNVFLANADATFPEDFAAIGKNLRSMTENPQPEIPHLLEAKFQNPKEVQGWLRIELSPDRAQVPAPKLRMLTFNAVSATGSLTIHNELLGIADGRPGQEFRLLQDNIIDGSLELAISEAADDKKLPLVTWHEIDSLDCASAWDRVFEIDREAGLIRFGDGQRGRIPMRVPDGGSIVALRYRHGGGVTGNIPVSALEKFDSGPTILNAIVNFVVGSGGRDAEQLEDAKRRARKELSTRSRAVTADDFAWITLQTPGVRVARAIVVPLRRPLLSAHAQQMTPLPVGGQPLSPHAAGLANFVAAGAVSVVVVPDEAGSEPAPTPSHLKAVCRHLDQHRLVTTEVYVVPPQFVRFCDFFLVVRSHPGFTRVQVHDQVEGQLAKWLHVLTGGDNATGFPFGGQVHIADMIAQVLRTPSVERVEVLSCRFRRTKSNARPRQGRLALCPNQTDEFDRLELAPEETVSFDSAKFILNLSSSQGTSTHDPHCSYLKVK